MKGLCSNFLQVISSDTSMLPKDVRSLKTQHPIRNKFVVCYRFISYHENYYFSLHSPEIGEKHVQSILSVGSTEKKCAPDYSEGHATNQRLNYSSFITLSRVYGNVYITHTHAYARTHSYSRVCSSCILEVVHIIRLTYSTQQNRYTLAAR